MSDDRRPEEWRPDGQGAALPDSAGVEGQWIWPGHLFLYKPPDGQKTDNVTMTMALRRADGNAMPGVDAIGLAEELRVSLAELFDHNSAGTLLFAARRDEPQHGGLTAITYRFRIGRAEAYRTFEEGVPEGHA